MAVTPQPELVDDSAPDALSLIPPGKQYDNLRGMLREIKKRSPKDYARISAQKDRILGFVKEIDSGKGRDDDQIRDDIATHMLKEEGIMRIWGVDKATAQKLMLGKNEGGLNFSELDKPAGPGTTTRTGSAPKEEKTAKKGVGGGGADPKTQLTILSGKEMKWYFDRASGKWMVGYGLPGSNRMLVFEADPSQMDALFGKDARPTNYQTINTKSFLAKPEVIFAGSVAEMEGKGTFEDEYDKVISLAMDNGSLPSWMKDSAAARDFLFIAETEGKSNDWLFEQFATLPEFKKRFPKIQTIMKEGNLTLPEAITGFLEFEAGLTQAAQATGLSMVGPNAITPDMVGSLLDRGWSLQGATDAMKTYRRMATFAPAKDAFNRILQHKGLAPIESQQDWYNFMNGRAPQHYYDIYEASSVQEAAVQAGLGDIFKTNNAIEAALQHNISPEGAMQSMQEAAKLLLRLRTEIDTKKFGLNNEDLIDASLGIKPTSGVSEAELFENVNRATLAAQANLRNRAKPMTSVSGGGIPQAASLGSLQRES